MFWGEQAFLTENTWGTNAKGRDLNLELLFIKGSFKREKGKSLVGKRYL